MTYFLENIIAKKKKKTMLYCIQDFSKKNIASKTYIRFSNLIQTPIFIYQ